MPMNASDIERLIKAGIPDAEVTIRDLAGDGDHYAATVIAESFFDLRRDIVETTRPQDQPDIGAYEFIKPE